jgi:nitroreductase
VTWFARSVDDGITTMEDPMSSDPTDVLRPLRRTRQVREFQPTPLAPEVLDALADVARWTGSSENSQPWRFIVITEPSTLKAIHAAGLPQTRGLATAPAAIAIVLPADLDRAVHDAYDDGRVAERLLVAAAMLDIGAGISWIRSDVRPAIATILGLPSDWTVRSIVQLGIPTAAAREPKSAPGEARLPREDVVFRERWPSD